MVINVSGFPGLLTLLFIGLKLTNYIDWSWLWVLSPLWLPIVLLALIALCAIIFIAIFELVKSMTRKKV
jgi:hypothetical protein